LRRFALRFPDIEFIIFDEGHRATAKSYRAIMDAYPRAKLLFVTATPDRSDGVGLKAVCESIAHEYNIVDATADGWLTPLRFVPVSADIDLSAIKVTKQMDGEKDFDAAALDDAITHEAGRIAAAVVKALESLGPTSRGIAFTPGVKTAHACAAALNTLLPGTAGVVDGEMSDAEKRPVLQAHREGRLRVVFNCNVLSEGYDDPTLDFVFDASPSHSRQRVAQRWGRVTRLFSELLAQFATPAERRAAISASPKPWAVVFDLVSNSAEHDVIGPDDLLAGKDLPPDVRKRVREIMNTEGGVVSDAVERAEKEAAEKKRRAWAAKCAASAASVTVGEPRSIFDRAGIDFIRRQKMAKRPDKLASHKMIGLLKFRKIPVPRACSETMFRRLLTMDERREKQGKCRLGGIEWLRPFGVDAWKLSGAQAKRVHDAIKAKGYRKLTKDELGEAIERIPGEEG
jgi:superfamily II DNA or RNA helicase